MNKIVIDKSRYQDIDDTIIYDKDIDIIKDTNLILEINDNIDININIETNINANIYLLINSEDIKLRYNLTTNSKLNVYGFTKHIDNNNIIINLNGINSNINYVMKTISSTTTNYKYMVYHNDKNTVSNIINNGVNIKDGNLVIDISSYIPKGITGCIANQISRIINLTTNKCIIRPNLLIDEEDVEANHSALIGTFSDDEIFYLESRGISYDDTVDLLTKGFIYSRLDDNMKDLIKEIDYWR